jgi:DNA-binding transcriptional ArsR family regulator
MNEDIRERYEARANVMKAFGHASRLYIVDELSRGERCVHELTDVIGSDMSTVSKHLGVLKSAGIVCDEKRGSEVYYSLRMGCVVDFFGCLEAVLSGGEASSCSPGSTRQRRVR